MTYQICTGDALAVQSSLMDGGAGVVWRPIALEEANRALTAWGHRMGEIHRPFAGDSAEHGLIHDGKLVAVACTAGLIRESVGGVEGIDRSNAVELARLCAARPGLCRVALRLWREFTWPSFGRAYAVSYQDADLHTGNTYRFDGWERRGFSASGTDSRSGRAGRRKWVWVWPRQGVQGRIEFGEPG